MIPSIRWVEPTPIEPPQELVEYLGGFSFLAASLMKRGIRSIQHARRFLDPKEGDSPDPTELPGMQAAVDRILSAIKRKEQILIWGDFDVDGQTSTTILVQTLKSANANVSYHIPVRGSEGHGIHLLFLQEKVSRGTNLIITCDTGISAVDAGVFCSSNHIDLIVTDHHTLPSIMPKAYALVNPHFLPPEHAFSPLCGAGVAFQLAKALTREISSDFDPDKLLDLTALGTIADVADLCGANRGLVKLGIEKLRSTNRLAMRNLFENASIHPPSINEDQISFQIAPRLNAVGRLSDANPVIEFLTSKDDQFVNLFALTIEGLNGQRRILLEEGFSGAMKQIEINPSLLDSPVLILSHTEWPVGILGLIASRLVQYYHKPTVVLNMGKDGIALGSARSVEDLDIIQAITQCSGFLLTFGGHAMAAGLSLRSEYLPKFRKQLAESVNSLTPVGLREEILEIDNYIEFSEITSQLVAQVERIAPFGTGNSPVVFSTRNVEIITAKPMGRNGEHTKLLVKDLSGETRELIRWQSPPADQPGGRIDLAFTPRRSNFRGSEQINLEWIGFRQCSGTEICLRDEKSIEIVDHRVEKPDMNEIEILSQNPDILVFREGKIIPNFPKGVDRDHLTPANTLIILSVPPGWELLVNLIETVKPERLIVYGVDLEKETLASFMNRLSGLVKFAWKHLKGEINLPYLAIQCNQTEVFVRLCLVWLASRGDITIQEISDLEVRISIPGLAGLIPSEEISTAINSLFQESQAFQEYFNKTDLFSLMNYQEK